MNSGILSLYPSIKQWFPPGRCGGRSLLWPGHPSRRDVPTSASMLDNFPLLYRMSFALVLAVTGFLKFWVQGRGEFWRRKKMYVTVPPPQTHWQKWIKKLGPKSIEKVWFVKGTRWKHIYTLLVARSLILCLHSCDKLASVGRQWRREVVFQEPHSFDFYKKNQYMIVQWYCMSKK